MKRKYINVTKEQREFFNIIEDLIKSTPVQEMKKYKQHYDVSCYTHSLEVSYLTYLYCKKHKLDYVSAARGALLHDLFLYDWHVHQDNLPVKGKHAFAHPKIALINANKCFKLNKKEQDIIVKHMWPVTLFHIPKYRESFIVTLIDKGNALRSCRLYYSKRKKQI